jgi:hypothetical protein
MLFSAIGRIKSEEAFIEIVYSQSKYYSRRMAVRHIKSQDVLKDLALNDESDEIRRIASKRIA